MKGTDFDKLASSKAVNRASVRVTSRGEHWEPSREITGIWSKDQLQYVEASDFLLRQLYQRHRGNGFDPCKLTVLGVEPAKQGDKLQWICRCACGNHCSYTVAQLRGFKKPTRGPAVEVKKYTECPVCTYFSERKAIGPMGRGPKSPGVTYLDDDAIEKLLDKSETDVGMVRFKGRRLGRLVVLGPAKHHPNLLKKPNGKSIARCDCGSAFIASRKGLAAGNILECDDCREAKRAAYRESGDCEHLAAVEHAEAKLRLEFLKDEQAHLQAELSRLTRLMGRATTEDRVALKRFLDWDAQNKALLFEAEIMTAQTGTK